MCHFLHGIPCVRDNCPSVDAACNLQSLHRESTTLRKFDRSSVSKFSAVSASFIAARVVLFGFSETKASSTLSTRLFRLRLCFFASIWRRFNKFSLNRNEVCFLVTDAVFIVIPLCSAKVVHLYNTFKYLMVQLPILFPYFGDFHDGMPLYNFSR